MLTKEAFNALLKTIEEPPDHAYFLLATTELQKVPETIRSRCQVFTFHRFTLDQIAGRLQEIADKEKIQVADKDALLLIAKKSTGGLRDAIGLFEQASASGEVSVEHLRSELGIASVSQIEEFFGFLTAEQADCAIAFVGEISSEGLSLDDFLEQLLGFLREKMLHFSMEEENPSALAFVLDTIDSFDIARRSMRDAPIPTLPVEIAIVKTTKMRSLESSEKDSGGWHIFGKKTEKSEKKEEILPNETQEKKEEKVQAQSDVVEISEENIHRHWGKVLEKIDDAMLRAALGQGIISQEGAGTVSVAFSAESWKKQVEEAGRFAKFETAVREIFGPETSIILKVESVILQPIEKSISSDIKEENPVTDPSVISEIFGTK